MLYVREILTLRKRVKTTDVNRNETFITTLITSLTIRGIEDILEEMKIRARTS
jgi:phage antirepressor YoqD-like protein